MNEEHQRIVEEAIAEQLAPLREQTQRLKEEVNRLEDELDPEITAESVEEKAAEIVKRHGVGWREAFRMASEQMGKRHAERAERHRERDLERFYREEL